MAGYIFVLCPTVPFRGRPPARWHIVSHYTDQTFCGHHKPIPPEWPRTTEAVGVWETGLPLCDHCNRQSYKNARRFLDRIPAPYEQCPAGDLDVGDRFRWYGKDRTVLSRRTVAGRGFDATPPRRWVALRLSDWPGEPRILLTTLLLRSFHVVRSEPDPAATAGTPIRRRPPGRPRRGAS